MNTIALVGNPNSGKSTLFNALTGSTQFVGNWPGVTVEKKKGKTHIDKDTYEVVDLPGIYSLSPYSNEEIISRDFVLNEHPDVVVDIVDASNLERNLYLTTQVIELGVPTIVALNMIDVVNKKGEKLDAAALSKELGCPVCEISAVSGKGVKELKQVIASVCASSNNAPKSTFAYSADVAAAIDSVKASLGSNDSFVALKVLAADESLNGYKDVAENVIAEATQLREKLEKDYDDDFDSIIAEQRYVWIKSIINSVIVKRRSEKVSLSDKIDKVLTNKWLALPIFFVIIYAIYFVCLNPKGLGKYLVGVCFGGLIKVMGWAQAGLEALEVWPWLTDMIVNGIIFGLGIVIAFVPYLMVLFVFLAILEECGYMARVTFIMDRVFRRFGLSGKSFIPMLLGTGCTVQAVAATRTIEDENDRRMTIFLTPFIPCATMMPTIILFVTMLTNKAWVAPFTYLIAILFVILGGIFLKHTMLKGKPAPFVMELPEYKIPRLKNVWHFVWDRTVSFFRKASTIILVSTVVIWFLKYFSFSMQHVGINDSMLASIGKFIAPIFAPIGLAKWEVLAALITGFVAKDNFMGTLAQIYGKDAITEGVLSTILTPASAVSFLLFFILSSPCFASMGAMQKELGSNKLTAKAIGFQFGTAYLVSLIAYQILRLIPAMMVLA